MSLISYFKLTIILQMFYATPLMSKENVRSRIKNRRKKSFTEKAESDEYFINNTVLVIEKIFFFF